LDLNQRAKSTKEILELIKKYKNNTLDTAANVGGSLRAHPTTLPKEIKEVKRKREENLIENNKDLEKVKKDYEKLEQIFSEVTSEKEDFLKAVVFTMPVLFVFGMMYLFYFLDNTDFSGKSLSIFFSLLLIGTLTVFSFFYEKITNNSKENKISNILKLDLKELKVDDELVYLLIDEKFGKADVFFEKDNLNKGKLIIYKNLLKKIEDK
jgi:hypothetical protein